MKLYRFLIIFFIVTAAACSGVPDVVNPDTPQETALQTDVPPVPTVTFDPAESIDETGPLTLRVWIPPEFDPNAGTRSSELLNARLSEFSSRRSDIRLDVRVKAVDGPGGLLDALTAASSAAPKAVPDLIAIPRFLMETAALKGLLYPFDGLTSLPDADEWYGYAREMALIQDSIFGLPFAGDALALLYQSSIFEETPADFASILNSSAQFAFPASESSSLLTLNLYMAAGGPVKDEQGRPTIDAVILGKVLEFYQQGELNTVIPAGNIQLDTLEQAYREFAEGNVGITLISISRYLSDRKSLTESAVLAPVPTHNGIPYSLASGWVWALSTSDPERQAQAVELAEFLMDPSFLSDWNLASNSLPTSSAALASWEDTPMRDAVAKVAASSHLAPSSDLISSLGPAIRIAVIQVLSRQGEPAALAEDAASKVR
nr:MAG: extracellular solute-binding protein [Chloroflexota bacterium]